MTVQELIQKLQEFNATDKVNFGAAIEGTGVDEIFANEGEVFIRKEDGEVVLNVVGTI